MINSSLAPIPKARLNDSVYDVIKENILSQVFAPEQRLDINELSHQLEVSATPLKDALNRLAAEGLVEIIPRRGTYVTSLKPTEIAETFEVRKALEVLAVQLFLERALDIDLQEIANMISRLDEYASSQDRNAIYQEYVNVDRAMHRRIVELARNQRLLAAYEREHSHMYMARARYGTSEESLEQAQEEHRHLREAVLARNIPLAQEIIDKHIQRAKESLLNEIREVQT
jgi:GntR family transcriptional regulator, rspAB operon transcriptional repressor